MECLNGHFGRATGWQMEVRFGEGLHLFDGGVGGDFAEEEALRGDVDEGKFGDDVIDDFDTGEREGAFFEDFGLVVAGGMLHGDEDALGAGNEVHGAAHAFEHFAGDSPVGEGSLFVDLQRAEDGEVDMSAANHGEGIGGREIDGAGLVRGAPSPRVYADDRILYLSCRPLKDRALVSGTARLHGFAEYRC